MTSIEWLIDQLVKMDKQLDGRRKNEDATVLKINPTKIYEQAKEMHKQEIIDAINEGIKQGYIDYNDTEWGRQNDYNPEQYYQETFVSKGSNDMASNCSEHVTKNHTLKTAFEILQSNLTIDDTSEFRKIHIPEIIASMEQYKAQFHKQDVDKLGNEDVSKLGYCEISDEEIEKRVKEVGAMGDWYKMGYRDACKWYREQLKQRNG